MPTDFRTKKIALVKGWHWDLKITIESVLFNLDRWRWIPIHYKNPLVNLWQRSSEWCEILDSLHHQTELHLQQEILVQPLIKWTMISLPYGNESPIVCSVKISEHINVYCKDTFMSIIGIYMLSDNQRDFPGITKIHVALMDTIHMLLQKMIQTLFKYKRFGTH